MPETRLHVVLLSHTPSPETVCALAARTCYSALDEKGLEEKVSSGDQSAFLRGIVKSGHLSVLEHASFTFFAEGVSRSLLAQISRHRIASFSVQSQRYVNLSSGFDYVIPPRIKELGEEEAQKYAEQMQKMHEWYLYWQDKLGENANEDARFVLPNACETHITFTMNARELLHFFSLRCCNRAQWEIRELATEMLRLCREKAPVIFENAGPGCVRGSCPEGGRTCGKAQETRERFAAL